MADHVACATRAHAGGADMTGVTEGDGTAEGGARAAECSAGGPAKGGAGPAEGCGVPVGMIDVAAVDDHPIVLDGITGWVMAADSGIRVVATAATVASLLAGPGRRAHVVLLDLDLGDGTTVERNIAAITAAGPAVLVLAASDKPLSVLAAMRAGALGYVLKNEESAQVRAAIKAVAAGQDWISPRLAYIFAADDAPDRPSLSKQETRALRLYATGMPMKSVARRMTISEETAKQYVGRVREKYARAGRAAPTKLDLYYRAVEDGHLPPLP
jgi:two-component system, NarL family, nitrate/nitrite response regulator NarL